MLLLLYHEKRVDVVCVGAKTRDVGRLAYRSLGRKNPGLYEPINKAVDTEPVIGPAYRFAPGSGALKDSTTEPGARSKERV